MEGYIPNELIRISKLNEEYKECAELCHKLEEKIKSRKATLEDHNSSEKIQARLEARKDKIKERIEKKESQGSKSYEYNKSQIEEQKRILESLTSKYNSEIEAYELKKENTINMKNQEYKDTIDRIDAVYDERIRILIAERDRKKENKEKDHKLEIQSILQNMKPYFESKEKQYQTNIEKHQNIISTFEKRMEDSWKKIEQEIEELEKKQNKEQLSSDENNDLTLCGLKNQLKTVQEKQESISNEIIQYYQNQPKNPAPFLPPKPKYNMASAKGDRICDLEAGKQTDWNAVAEDDENLSVVSESVSVKTESKVVPLTTSIVPNRPQTVQEIQEELRRKEEEIRRKQYEREEKEKYLLSKEYLEEAKRKMREKDREEEDDKEAQKQAFIRERTEKLKPEFGENIPQEFFKYPFLTVEQYYKNQNMKQKKKEFLEEFGADLTEKEIQRKDELEYEELEALYECTSLKEVRKFLGVEKLEKPAKKTGKPPAKKTGKPVKKQTVPDDLRGLKLITKTVR